MPRTGVTLRFGEGTAFLIFDAAVNHIEMPLDKAIEIFDECHKRCIAEKLRQSPPPPQPS